MSVFPFKVGQILRATDLDSLFNTPVANVVGYGAKGDGVTDDTVRIQEAAESLVNGGVLLFPGGYNFLVSATIFLLSGTTVQGFGSTITTSVTWNNPSFPSAPDGFSPGKQAFVNTNWNVSAITDHDIRIIGLNFNNAANTGVSAMHFVQNVEEAFLRVTGGAGVCAHIATDGTNFHDNTCLNCSYSAADHFSGATNARVCHNYIKMALSISTAPAIQFTGAGPFGFVAQSFKFTCIGNQVYGAGSLTSAISITEGGGTSSSATDIVIADNIVEMSGYPSSGGISLYGGGSNWNVSNNTISNVSNHVAMILFGNGFGTPSSFHVNNNRILNSTAISAPGVLLSIVANDVSLLDNDMVGCTCTIPFTVTGNNVVVRTGRMDSGSSGAHPRGQVTGSVTFLDDYDLDTNVRNSSSAIQSSVGFQVGGGSTLASYLENQSWTPVLAFGGASVGITYTTQTATYQRIGKTVFFQGAIVLSSKGSSTGNVTITGAPFSSQGVIAVAVDLSSTVNFTGLSAAPVASITSNVIKLYTSTLGSGTQLADTNFQNTTGIFFSGVCSLA